MKKCIVISDSFKGSLPSRDICAIACKRIPLFFPACDDGVADAEKGRDSVFHRFLVFCGIKIQLFFQNGSGCSGRYAQKKAALRPVGSKRRYEKKG